MVVSFRKKRSLTICFAVVSVAKLIQPFAFIIVIEWNDDEVTGLKENQKKDVETHSTIDRGYHSIEATALLRSNFSIKSFNSITIAVCLFITNSLILSFIHFSSTQTRVFIKKRDNKTNSQLRTLCISWKFSRTHWIKNKTEKQWLAMRERETENSSYSVQFFSSGNRRWNLLNFVFFFLNFDRSQL